MTYLNTVALHINSLTLKHWASKNTLAISANTIPVPCCGVSRSFRNRMLKRIVTSG